MKPQPEPEKEAAEKQKIDDQTPESGVPIKKSDPGRAAERKTGRNPPGETSWSIG